MAKKTRLNNARLAAAGSGFAQAVKTQQQSSFSFGQRIAAVPRLVGATLQGRYPGLGKPKLAMWGLALLYVVSPIDIVPEAFLLMFGLADDVLLGGFVASSLLSETEQFLAWEQDQAAGVAGNPVIPGEVVR